MEKGGLYLRVKARPGAPETKIREIFEDEHGEVLKIDVAAEPVKGRANIELVRFLAKELKVGKENIKIISGAGEKLKLIKINVK